MPPRLSVNLNKVALLRNSRGGTNPSPRVAAHACIDAGALGITLHWRGDQRHTRIGDVRELREICRERRVEFNLEGDDRAELLALADELVVDQFTLVPVKPGEITSDHGWDLPGDEARVRAALSQIKNQRVRRAIFVEVFADAAVGAVRMASARRAGAARVEVYTEPFAAAWNTPRRADELARLKTTAQTAVAAGLGVNAGHDLDLHNMPTVAREVPEILEVSIGHALIADALYLGFPEAVHRYVRACHGEDVAAPITC